MNVTKTYRMGLRAGKVGTVLLIVVFMAGPACAQDLQQAPFATEVAIELLSAEVIRFAQPIRIGVGERSIEYQEALVLKGQVDRAQLDSLPPSIEPFLYIGRNEYRIFQIDRDDDRRELMLTFHIRDWENLPDGASVVLTIDHGAPVRDPERFTRPGVARFSKQLIVDNR